MRIFITGIKGFMGSHLSHFLKEKGHTISGIDNDFHSSQLKPAGNYWYGDIRNYNEIVKATEKCDLVIHLAAQIHVDYSIQHPRETLDINVGGTLNVLEACRLKRIPCIIASTSEAYGSSQSEFMDENHPLDCQSPYGASKVAADRLAKSYIDTYAQEIVIVRNFNAFGPYQNDGSYGSVISKFTKAAMKNEPLYIYGSGEQERDYMYIDDIIQAYDFVIHHLPSGVYNFGTGKAYKVKYIAEQIIKLTRSTSKIVHIEDRAGEVQRLCCDISKVSKYGFKPTTEFDRDLKKYVEWYKWN